MTVARVLLGLAMMPYAIDKLFDLQFKVPAWSYAQPLGSTSGSTLAWAMFGYSARLQILLGIFELVPGLLLLNVRTRRVGALLLFPVLLNIVLINFFLDLWHGTKVVSATLLAVDVLLILYDHKLYRDLFVRLLVFKPPVASEGVWPIAKIANFTISTAAIVLTAAAFGYSVVNLQKPVSDLTGFPQINGKGSWKVDSLTIAGNAVSLTPGTSFFFNTFNTCVYGVPLHPSFGNFDADQSRHTFQIRQVLIEGSTSIISGTYELENDRLRLDGRRNGQQLSFVLSRLQYRKQSALY